MNADRARSAAFAVLVCGLYGPVACRLLNSPSDYTAHVHFAELLFKTRVINHPHFLYQGMVCLLVWLAPGLSFQTSGLLVVLVAYAALGILVYREAGAALRSGGSEVAAGATFFAALCIVLMQPVILPTDGYHYQIGYLWPEPYLSPTFAVVKPLALVAVLHAARFLEPGQERAAWAAVSLCAISVAAGALTKPNFALCLVPAAFLWAGYNAIRRKPFSGLGIAVGVLLPGAAVLAWQYYQSYSGMAATVNYRDAIIFAPLAVMRYHAKGLAYKFLLSVLFPACAYLAWFRRSRRDTAFNFAWLLFGFGALYTYTVAEKLRLWMGNFLWCSYISCFVLFVMAARFFLRQVVERSRDIREAGKCLFCGAVGLLHVASGLMVEWNYLRYALGPTQGPT